MTELVLGKKLACPPLKEHFKEPLKDNVKAADTMANLVCEQANNGKMQTKYFGGKTNASRASPDPVTLDPKNEFAHTQHEQKLGLISPIINEEEAKVPSQQKLQRHVPRNEPKEATLDSFITIVGDEMAQEKSEEYENSTDGQEVIQCLDTDSAIGKSVALMMGQKVSRYKNVFDLMDDAAAKLMKNIFRKKQPSEVQLEDPRTDEKTKMFETAHAQEVIVTLDESALVRLPIIHCNHPPDERQRTSPAMNESQIPIDLHKAGTLPPIVILNDSGLFKRERRAFKSPPVLQNQAIKETFKRKFENFRMGAGRFTFDDIEAKSKEQLIDNLRKTGSKMDLKQLQNESEPKLREILKERLTIAFDDMKPRHERNIPFFRLEQIFSKRAPEEKVPSPETMKKWHAAAKKAGVPMEALTNLTPIKASSEQESNFGRLEGPSNREDQNMEPPTFYKTRSKPTIPRSVNPDNMELLLTRVPPQIVLQPPIKVSVNVALRIAENDILWKKLCPFDSAHGKT